MSPPDGASGDLTGTWDLVSTSPSGVPRNGTLTIAREALTLDLGSLQLAYATANGQLDVTWTANGNASNIATQRSPAALDLGIVPLDVGGSWRFASQDGTERCTALLSPASWTGSCDSPIAGWPPEPPPPTPGVTYNAIRTQQLPSVFGDLGGVWSLTDGQGGPGSCTVTFNQSGFSATCNAATEDLAGTVQVTFDGTSMASGTTSYGYELSAHKQ